MITRLLRTAAPVRGLLTASTLLRIISLLGAAGLLLLPVWALSSHPGLSPVLLGVLMAGLALGAAVCRWGEQVCGHRAAFTLLAQMRVDLYTALAAQGTPRIAAGSGQVMSVATRDINAIEVFFAHTIAPGVAALVLSLGAGVALFAVDPVAGVIGVVAVAVGWLIPLLGGHGGGAEAAVRGRIAQHLSEDAAGRLEIRSHGAQRHRLGQLDELEAILLRGATTRGLLLSVRQALALIWPWSAALAVIVTTGELPAAAVILALAPALDALEGFVRTLPTALESARRYYALIDAPVAVPDAGTGTLPGGPLGVDWRGITVDHARPVLEDFSLRIAPGEHVGVVGPSGTGKSTLVATLLRLLDPEQGEVRLGGTDVRDIPLRTLRAEVAVVEQESVLFRGTVLDNLRTGNPGLGETAARAALAAAQIGGVEPDTDASALSGGQRQRLCLARALARGPRVLILDEATSHQDALNQAELAAMLRRLSGTTVLIIAHRRAALTGVDRVIALG